MGLNDSTATPKGNVIYISISHNLDGGMGYYTGKGNQRQFHSVKNVSGRVVELSREFDEGSSSARIKPHHKYCFLLQDGEEQYLLQFPEHITYTTDILNQFLLASVADKIELHVLSCDKAKMRVKLCLIQNGKEVPRQYTEWDSEEQTLVGVPTAKVNGEYDYTKRNGFWFDKYKSVLYPKFNGGEEWKETSDQKEESEPTAPPVNIYEGTTAETKPSTPTVYSTLQTKFKGMPPSEFIEKWAAINTFASQQIAKKTLTILEWDNLVVLANQLHEEFRAMQFPNSPQVFFMTDGTVKTSPVSIPEDYTDDLPF